MKPITKIITAVLFVAVCTVAFLSFRKKGQYKREHNPQKTVYLYELNPTVAVNTSSFPSMVRKLAGKSFTTLKQNQTPGGMRFTSNEPTEFYEVNEGEGRFSFSKNLSRYMGNYKPSLPEPKAAQQIATSFLRENKLMAENPEEMHLIHSGGLRADDGNGAVIDKLITLTYGRVIDGVPVVGKGSKIVVNIGEQGVVEGVIRNWKAFSSKKEIDPPQIKNQAELEKEFQVMVSSQFGKESKAEIRRSYLVYFDNGGRFLQPVMAFETNVTLGTSATGASKQIPYLGIVEVMKSPAEKLNLTGVDPAGIRTLNASKVSPEMKSKPLDKGD